MSKEKSLPLVWEYDGKGEWEAPSQVMDPDMTDKPQETWCKEWCLKWRIRVMEDGRFSCDESDQYLLVEIADSVKSRMDRLIILQAHIDLAEDRVRSAKRFELADGEEQPITLLPVDKYAK